MTIKTKILYFFKGSLVTKVFGFISFFFLAKVVSLDTFAIYTIFLFVSEMLLTFLGFGLNSYIMRNSNEQKRLEVFPKAMFTILTTLVFFVIVWIVFEPLFDVYLSGIYRQILEYKYVIFIILLNKSFISMCLGYFVSNHRAREHMFVNVSSSLSLLVSLLPFYFLFSITELDLIFYSLIFSTASPLFISFWFLRRNKIFQKVSFVEISRLINESYPFMLKNMIGILGLYLSRLVLESMATKEELAAYSFYLMIVFQLSFFVNILSQSIVPTIRDNFEKLEQLKDKINTYYKMFIILIAFVISFVAFISYFISIGKLSIFSYFIREEYLSYIWVFSILLIAFFVGSLRTLFDVWQYHESMDVKLKLIGISILNVVLGLIIYPIMYKMFNIYGVAFGYIILSTIFTYIGYYYFNDLQRRIKLEKNIYNS